MRSLALALLLATPATAETISQEIARTVQDVAQGAVGVTRNILAVSDATATARMVSASVQSAATGLSTSAQTLRREVDEFVMRVRA